MASTPALVRQLRSSALLALPLLALAAPAEAAVRYVAYGDSITRGNDCNDPGGGFPDYLFDNGPGCDAACNDQSAADDCGYAYRLVTELAGRGIDAEVENAGDGGETIIQGKVRLGSRISAGDDVLILKEGTNDLSKLIRGDGDAVSTTVMKNTLGLMVNDATDLGMDTLLISPIRRVCPEYPGTCSTTGSGGPIANPDEPNTTSLAEKISDLKNEKNRERLSGYQKFGKTQTDVDAHYFGDDPRIGHLDPSGYSKLADEIDKKIGPDDALGAPNPVSPSGDVDGSGVFVWDDFGGDPDEGATLFQLQIDGPLGGSFHNEFYEQADVCAGGTCSVDVGTISNGSYTWKARGNNLRGRGPYSADTAFTVVSGPPAVPTLISPPPDPPGAPPVAVTYTWNEVAQASEYRLQVDDTGGTVIDETFTAASVCGGGTCAATPATMLAEGDHSWRLRGSNGVGDGPWSGFFDFSVSPGAPDATTLAYPLTDVYQQNPITFRWFPVADADDYELDIDGDVTTFPAGSCTANLCESPEGPIGLGALDWRVRPTNTGGPGPWTSTTSLEVLDCDPPNDIIELDADDTGTGSLFTTCNKVRASNGYTVQNGEDVTFHTADEIEMDDGFVVEASGTFRVRNDH